MEHGVAAETWLALAAMILAAKLGGELALRLRRPAVLGELAIGVLLGNLHIAGLSAIAHGPDVPSRVSRGGGIARLAPGGQPLFSPGIYAALVAAVFVTTLIAPPALAARIRMRQRVVCASTDDKSETTPDQAA